MGNGALDILLEKPMIEGDRFRELFNAAVDFGRKRPFQGLLAMRGLPQSETFDA